MPAAPVAPGGQGSAGRSAPPPPPPPPRCNPVERVIDKVDLLFVVDNSGSMREEQELLRQQFPRLIRGLTTGDTDGDGVQDFPAVADLHLGVVSSDMGLVGITGIDKCSGLGDDGILLNAPSPAVAGCQPRYPRFLTYEAGTHDPLQIANDFACIASLGTDGCGFEQQLESALKALWPSAGADPLTGKPLGPNDGPFLGDFNGFGRRGHGDTDNAGFLRNDPNAGLSLVAVVVVTDEEDCSSHSTAHFTPLEFLAPSNPLAHQPLNLRCFFNPQNLYPVERYVNGLRALRPNNEALVVFAAIAGIPPDLVTPDVRARIDFTDPDQREAFYRRVLEHPAMQETVDPTTIQTPGAGNLVPSCNRVNFGKAYPPRRIVEVARGFGENGVIASICTEDFGPAVTAILSRIGERLNDPCSTLGLE
jgi:hypothetical protein